MCDTEQTEPGLQNDGNPDQCDGKIRTDRRSRRNRVFAASTYRASVRTAAATVALEGGARRQRPLECVDGPVVERLAIEIRPLDERPGPLSAVDVGELDA